MTLPFSHFLPLPIIMVKIWVKTIFFIQPIIHSRTLHFHKHTLIILQKYVKTAAKNLLKQLFEAQQMDSHDSSVLEERRKGGRWAAAKTNTECRVRILGELNEWGKSKWGWKRQRTVITAMGWKGEVSSERVKECETRLTGLWWAQCPRLSHLT